MNILVVESEPFAGKMLSFLLRGEGFEVETAPGIRAARLVVEQRSPRLVMLATELPDGDSLQFCRELAAEIPRRSVILLSREANSRDIIAGLSAGADDYILKPYEGSELIGRVKAISKRYTSLRSAPVCDHLKVGRLELFFRELKVRVGGQREVRVTPTEMKILSFMMANAGKVLPREQIAEEALGYRFGSDSNAIEVYIRRLRSKLQEVFIETVPRGGYRLCPEEVFLVS